MNPFANLVFVDGQTLTLAAIAITLVMAGSHLLVSQRYPQEPSLIIWSGANFAIGFGLSIQAMWLWLPNAVPNVLGNGMIVFALGLMAEGVRRFTGRPAAWRGQAILAFACFAILAIACATSADPEKMGVVVSAAFGLGWGIYTIVILMRPIVGVTSVARRALLITFGAVLAGRAGVLATTFGAGVTWHLSDQNNTPLGLIASVIALVMFVGTMSWNTVVLVVVLDRLASFDDLTKLLNRRAFLSAATRQLESVVFRNDPGCLLMLDIDHFKQVNDRFGHAVGDQVLKTFADGLKVCVRRDDLVGRIGGEEFCIFLPGCDLAAARRIAESIRNTTKQRLAAIGGFPIQGTVSTGIAEHSPALHTIELLCVAADSALYDAKASGRDVVRIFSGTSVDPERVARFTVVPLQAAS
ncbi:GGDEF domain-containing protein [Segnochrobactrum spirostomi]|uniref:diguanylate cyclase n=1 Tax=Segnochrobactrum spirostomi TaxID=2608987 RepID=A0A6A7Y8L8_9HYPH|nr:GGDEF domain-containing protein [Segnochrobactrum spirostomi]MQT13829.1 GGDEF domain-containing protein [Segnochrobactrum spirostomi]